MERLDRWSIHPEKICTHKVPLGEAAKAYDLADKGESGKVCIVFDD